jgi:hypothetical protein
METIEDKARRMLEQWAPEMRDGAPGSFGSLGIDGNMALTETQGIAS